MPAKWDRNPAAAQQATDARRQISEDMFGMMATSANARSFRKQPAWSLPRDIAHFSPEDQAALLQLNAARTPYAAPSEYSMGYRRGLPYEFE